MPRRLIRCNKITAGKPTSKDLKLTLTVPNAVGFGNGVLASGLEFREQQEVGTEGGKVTPVTLSISWGVQIDDFGFTRELSAITDENGLIVGDSDDDQIYPIILNGVSYLDTINKVEWRKVSFSGPALDEPEFEDRDSGMAFIVIRNQSTSGTFVLDCLFEGVLVGNQLSIELPDS